MRFLFNAMAAFLMAALFTGHLPPLNQSWRGVAADIHQAEPQAKVKAQVKAGLDALLSYRKG